MGGSARVGGGLTGSTTRSGNSRAVIVVIVAASLTSTWDPDLAGDSGNTGDSGDKGDSGGGVLVPAIVAEPTELALLEQPPPP